jgi:hypothetical protein
VVEVCVCVFGAECMCGRACLPSLWVQEVDLASRRRRGRRGKRHLGVPKKSRVLYMLVCSVLCCVVDRDVKVLGYGVWGGGLKSRACMHACNHWCGGR